MRVRLGSSPVDTLGERARLRGQCGLLGVCVGAEVSSAGLPSSRAWGAALFALVLSAWVVVGQVVGCRGVSEGIPFGILGLWR